MEGPKSRIYIINFIINLFRVRFINQYNKGCKLLRFCGVVSFVVVMN